MKVYVQIPISGPGSALSKVLEQAITVSTGYLNGWVSIEHLGMQVKSDFHPAETGTALPSKEVPAESELIPAFPKTLQEVDSLLSSLGISHLETAVNQWLIEGYVTSSEYRNLVSRLDVLVRGCDTFRQVLLQIHRGRLRLEAEAKASRRSFEQ